MDRHMANSLDHWLTTDPRDNQSDDDQFFDEMLTALDDVEEFAHNDRDDLTELLRRVDRLAYAVRSYADAVLGTDLVLDDDEDPDTEEIVLTPNENYL